MRAAEVLFGKASYLTRMHTWLAPADMTADPVFSFNPSLPDVAAQHEAQLVYRCGVAPYTYMGRLTTEHGFAVDDERKPIALLPWAERIEILREAGPPEVVLDNAPLIRALLALPDPPGDTNGGFTVTGSGSGCAITGPDEALGQTRPGLWALLLPLALVLRSLRRNKARSEPAGLPS